MLFSRGFPANLVVLRNTSLWFALTQCTRLGQQQQAAAYSAAASPFLDFLGSRWVWMLGSTPPLAMVTVPSSLLSSSSLRMASWMWRGTMRFFLLSRAALPASSSTSAARYSSTAARYTGAPAPMRSAYLPFFR
ncbi:hypothetical protein COO60DRAFT_468234 [Scenedesmus sp. NREL 46B-D3]|nr:hypothetical protein COO60DRAFT_1091220 [Scenedesmus sp. NREL 46B-D3]KAF6253136.1 hypothetical protein COO60DRAFT_468234 [Scenedesmus sp. NREL 46B-D3]